MSRPPVVIVGSGAAGLSAALVLAGHRPVTIVTKGALGDGATAWAQGGLAAVSAADDSFVAHTADTVDAGGGLCDERTVRDLVESAPAAIDRLVRLGARFDHTADGGLDLGLEGGHRARRIVHCGGDASGAEVARVLALAVRRAADAGQLTLLEHTWALDAVRDERGSVSGVRVMDAAGRPGRLPAEALVLATGGIGRLWAATTNPATATGDGLALAARAGAVLRDVEFMQFHPTLLAAAAPGDPGVLITEALRGEGAVLVGEDGRRIMPGVHPAADLAPRDVVSAALHEHLQRHGAQHAYLDGTMLAEPVWRRHFPTVLRMCRARGVDPVAEPIPVRPGAHYHCGGVAADLTGRTSVPGLFAIGEVARTGVHGANRLASNSVTEALVAGQRCGLLLRSAGTATGRAGRSRPRPPADGVSGADRDRVVAAVTRHAGVSRDADGLAALDRVLRGVDAGRPATTTGAAEGGNLLLVARLVAAAAAARRESRGCHRRSDFRQTDPAWSRHIDVRLADDAQTVTVAAGKAAAA